MASVRSRARPNLRDFLRNKFFNHHTFLTLVYAAVNTTSRDPFFGVADGGTGLSGARPEPLNAGADVELLAKRRRCRAVDDAVGSGSPEVDDGLETGRRGLPGRIGRSRIRADAPKDGRVVGGPKTSDVRPSSPPSVRRRSAPGCRARCTGPPSLPPSSSSNGFRLDGRRTEVDLQFFQGGRRIQANQKAGERKI